MRIAQSERHKQTNLQCILRIQLPFRRVPPHRARELERIKWSSRGKPIWLQAQSVKMAAVFQPE
jgi:hypothetical protein